MLDRQGKGFARKMRKGGEKEDLAAEVRFGLLDRMGIPVTAAVLVPLRESVSHHGVI